jgi:hypothetical protein
MMMKVEHKDLSSVCDFLGVSITDTTTINKILNLHYKRGYLSTVIGSGGQ